MQKPLEWRNMGYFQDMGLLFIYSLIVLLWKEPDRTLIFAILWAVILICGIYFIHGKSTKVLVCTLFALMVLVVPEIEMFYPILIYALIKEINWQMGLAISMAGVILLGKYGDMHIEIMAKYVVGCLLAAILERKTYKNDKMDIELRKTVDSGEEKALLLSEKIRRWQKNRIPKFMQQRFVKEIELQEKSMIMWDMCCLERFCQPGPPEP